jgi:uncharacterized protein (TIGR03435 family)
MAILAGSCLAIAQDGTKAPAFEAASVKLSSMVPTVNPGMHVSSSAGRLDYLKINLALAIREAYGLTPWQLERSTGPESMWTERYDIQATIPQPASKEQVQLMWQRLLAERFHLKVHWEEAQRPEYALVAGKGGLKIAPVPADPDKQHTARISSIPGGQRIILDYISMEKLLGYLGVGPVRNMTNTPGAFSFTLEYSLDPLRSGLPATDAEPTGEPLLPSFPDALRMKTGLEVERRVVPTKLLIVDHADRIPTPN